MGANGLLLATGVAVPGSRRARSGPAPVSWIEVALRWIDERLAELEHGEPVVDYVRLGQDPRSESASWAELYSLVVAPKVRATADGASDQADVQLVVTCMAGQDEMLRDPFASVRLAGRVWALLDEYKRSGNAMVGLGETRHVSLYLGRARIEDQNAGGQRAMRLPAVVCEAGRMTSGPRRN